MVVDIISIGDEILIGQVVNTNSSWIAENLTLSGFTVKRIITVSDNEKDIILALENSGKNCDIVYITGGLGPTNDDITKNTICKYFNTELKIDLNVLKDITDRWGMNISEPNRLQAEVPVNAEIIPNKCGTAPGLWLKKNNVIFIFTPGVPFEMKMMSENYIFPKLRRKFKGEVMSYKTILTQGIGESKLAEVINEWESNLPTNIKLAYLPQPGIVRLRLTGFGKEIRKINSQIKSQISSLNKIIPDYIFGYDNDSLEEIIGKLLKKNNFTLATAESCSGGLIAHMITSIPGSSEYYKGSIIAYSNDIKIIELGVKESSLNKYGAVSEKVVVEMAKGIKNKFNADFTIATSGIAGPGGATPDKQVGTTWIAIATPGKIIAEKFVFGDNRERNIRRTSITALNMLRKEIQKYLL